MSKPVEVTPEMIAAGFAEWVKYEGTAAQALTAIYLAMHMYRPLSEGPEA